MAVPREMVTPPGRRLRGRGNHQAEWSYVVTTPAAGHTHCAAVDDDGNGYTAPGPDGHVHEVAGLELLASGGHTHELGAERCRRQHRADTITKRRLCE